MFVRDLTRLGFSALIGAALLAGLGFAAVARAAVRILPAPLRRLGPATLLLAFLGTRFLQVPWRPGTYPIELAWTPGPEAETLRRGHGPVLFVPLREPAVRVKWEAITMYRSTAHWRPLVNGYAGYQPAAYAERIDLATKLPDPEALAALRRDTGLSTIVVVGGMFPNRVFAPWRAALADGALGDFHVSYDDGGILILDLATLP